jgi:hypothetical protein
MRQADAVLKRLGPAKRSQIKNRGFAMAAPQRKASETINKWKGYQTTDERIWLVSFMDYDLGYFDDETCRLEPLANPFGPKVLPMSPV